VLCVLLGVLMRFRKLDLKKKLRVKKKKDLITYYFMHWDHPLQKKIIIWSRLLSEQYRLGK